MAVPNRPLCKADVEAKIRELLLDKRTIREIRDSLGVSNDKVMRIRRLLLSPEPTAPVSVSSDAPNPNRNKNRNKTENRNIADGDIENTRKNVEFLALRRMQTELENPDCDIKVAKDALSVVGSRPKDAPESVTVILNQVYQFAALARERYWSEIEGKPSPQVIDVTAAPSDGPGELAAPEATQHPQADNPCDQAVEVTATQNNDIPADDISR